MNTRTIVVLAVCALLFVSSIDSKKVAKGEKKTKEAKVKAPKVEKEVVVVEEVSAPEIQKIVEEVHAQQHVDEEPHVQQPPVHKYKASPPKSLKVTSAYEQCKVECRKQRDTVQAKDYVEQLRAELVAAEQALAAENEAIAASASEAHDHAEAPAPVANH